MPIHNNKSSIKAVSLFICLTGVGVLLVNAFVMWKTYQFSKASVKDLGMVVSTPHGKYHPVVTFTTNDGKQIVYTQNGFHKGYEVGQKMEILYLSDDPEHPRENSLLNLWGFHGMFLLLGLAFVALGWIKYRNPNSKTVYTNFEK